MLYQTLFFLAGQLNSYFTTLDKPVGLAERPMTSLKNVSQLDEQDLKKANNVFLTLVNISEEAALKNAPGTYVVGGTEVHYENPPVNLNLYLLFTVCMANYEHALVYLSHIICYFQGKNSFAKQDSVVSVDGLPDDFHIILDLHSLSFEQANYLWSTLGGKQHPFICFKVRLVRLRRAAIRETRGVIREIRIDEAGGR